MKTLIYDRIRIRQGERGLRFRGGDLVEVLRPGRHWVRGRVFGAERDSVVKYDLTATRVDIPRLDVLLSQPNGLRAAFYSG